MENRRFIEELAERFEDDILLTEVLHERRLRVVIRSGVLIKVAEYFFKEKEFRFVIASGLHSGKGLEIFYHFSHDISGHLVNLQVILSPDQPEIDSLTAVFPAANWIEREIHELLGIRFKGHPNLTPLLSAENWPEGIYPYRKNFE
jgi:NADH:ubiquinone oxidoreductase subunit C